MTADLAKRKLLLCLIPAMLLPFLGALVYFNSASLFAIIFYNAVKLFMLLFPLVAVGWLEKQPLRLREIDWRAQLRGLPLGALTGLGIAAAILAAFVFTPLGGHVLQYGARCGKRSTTSAC